MKTTFLPEIEQCGVFENKIYISKLKMTISFLSDVAIIMVL